jgi:thiol:disulfide interchange protein
MRTSFLLLLSALVPALALGQDTPPEVYFKTEKATYKAGEDIKGTVTAIFAPGLHGYQNPPSKDYMLAVKVTGGAGTVVKSVSYPKGHMEMAGGEEAAVYSGTVSFPVVIAAPKGTGKQKIDVAFFYQQCDANMCYIPNTIPASAEVTIEAAVVQSPTIDVGEPAVNKPAPSTATVSVSNVPATVLPGAKYQIELVVQTKGKLTLVPSSGAQRVTVAGAEVVSVQEQDGAMASGTGETSRYTIELVAPAAEGEQEVALTVGYRQTDGEAPFAAQEGSVAYKLTVQTPPTTTTETPTQPVDQTPTSSSDGGLLGFLNNALEKGNWALIIPAALLTGLALCLTPCVFPMIPITVTFFSNQGAKTTGGRFSLGFFYALGIAVTYGAAGGIAAAGGDAVGELFTKTWFLFALGALMIVLALSMFDVYELRLPGFIQKNLKGRSGPVGALIMGLLMGFAAAPCAGALVLAVAVKVAEIKSIPVGLGMFGLIGLGMGLPFMALATASSGAKALPKSGGWLKTTKAVLGLVVIYIALDYLFKGLGLSPSEARTQYLWAAVFGAFAIFLLFFDKSDATTAVLRIKGVAAVGLGLLGGLAYSTAKQITFDEDYAKLVAEQGATNTDSQVVGKSINWIPYNDENFAKAVASGKPIMIDGRADWCTICHEMEARVFHTPEGLIALSGVYLLEVDWSTDVPKEYIDMTKKRFAIKGLPHVVFMEPGGKNEFSVGNIHDVAELKTHLRRVGAKL